MKRAALLLAVLIPVATVAAPINEGCSTQGSLLVCSLLPGTHTYAIPSGVAMVYLTNYIGPTLAVTRVQTATILGGWAEISVYLNFFGLCDAPPGYCPGNGLPDGKCPCQRDLDPGPGLRLVGPVGNMFEVPITRQIPDLTWGPDGFSVEPGAFVAIGDNPHGSPGTMFAVTVEQRPGAELVMRQPKMDNVIQCNGNIQVSRFEPWQADSDMTLTGAQVYGAGGGGAQRVTWACAYVFETNDDKKAPLWALCSHALATTGYVSFTKEVKKGQWVDGGAANACAPGQSWDYVASITAKRH